jgi:hypothetical protein
MTARTHISVRSDIYEEAKKIAKEFETAGRNLTMEDAFFLAKKKRFERKQVNEKYGFKEFWGL